MRFPLLTSIALVATALCVLPSCDQRSDKAPAGEPSPGAANDKSPIATVKISELNKHQSGTYTYGGKLFSGRALELHANGERYMENHYYEGYLHGPIRVFYENGKIKSDTHYEKGIANGIGLEWDTDGVMSQLFYKDGVVSGSAKPTSSSGQTEN